MSMNAIYSRFCSPEGVNTVIRLHPNLMMTCVYIYFSHSRKYILDAFLIGKTRLSLKINMTTDLCLSCRNKISSCSRIKRNMVKKLEFFSRQ